MEQCGIDSTFIKEIENSKTGHAIIILDRFKNNGIIVYEGASEHFPQIEITDDKLSKFLAQYKENTIKKNFYIENWVSKEKNLDLVNFFSSQGFTIYGDISWPELLTDQSLRKKINFVNPNFGEFVEMIKSAGYTEKICEEKDINDEELKKFNDFLNEKIALENWEFDLIVKLGSKGAVWFGENGFVYREICVSENLPLKDTTGAGDSFIAALIYITQQLEGDRRSWNKKEKAGCLAYCNIAGMYSCSRFGAQSGPTLEEIEKISGPGKSGPLDFAI